MVSKVIKKFRKNADYDDFNKKSFDKEFYSKKQEQKRQTKQRKNRDNVFGENMDEKPYERHYNY